MTEKILDAAAPPKRRWKWTKRIALAVGVCVLVLAGTILFLYHKAIYDLDSAAAEADRLDPGWRFEELEAKRADIADADNAALQVIAAHKLLPPSWPAWENGPFRDSYDLAKSLAKLAPNQALTAPQAKAMNDAWAAGAEAIAAARRLKDMPQGRYPIVRDRDGLPVPNMASRPIADLLYYDVLLRADEGEVDAALDSCRSYVNVARAYGDEPNHFTQQRRLEMRAGACQMIERVLAQGASSEGSLAALQKQLEDEEKQPVFLHGARGLRTWLDAMLEGVADGRVTGPNMAPPVATAFSMNVRPAALRMTTRLVEVAKLPVDEQQLALEQGGSPKSNEGPYLSGVFIVPKVQYSEHHLAHGQIRTQAELRCVIVALAAERYRLAHGQWPSAAAALVPAYLSAVPTDPYDRQPVRYLKREDGLVIYCVGPDRTDDKGKLDRGVQAPAGTDVGVQLWDVEQRRQPAPDEDKRANDQ